MQFISTTWANSELFAFILFNKECNRGFTQRVESGAVPLHCVSGDGFSNRLLACFMMMVGLISAQPRLSAGEKCSIHSPPQYEVNGSDDGDPQGPRSSIFVPILFQTLSCSCYGYGTSPQPLHSNSQSGCLRVHVTN